MTTIQEPPLPRSKHIDIVFDKLPGHYAPGFIEVENELGRSINFGTWVSRPDGYYALRIDRATAIHWLGVGDEQL